MITVVPNHHRNPRCWLNLPLPRDIRRLIHRKLDGVDLLMIEAAYFADSPQWYCSHTYTECESRQCTQYPDKSYRHVVKCSEAHEYFSPELLTQRPKCKWVELKCACARWNQGAVLTRFITRYPQLHREHPCGRDVFWHALNGNSTEFIHTHIDTYEHGIDNLFYWDRLDAITSHINADTHVETVRTLASYGAAINPGCYDAALTCDNTPIAEWCEAIAPVCWCGAAAQSMFGSCCHAHYRKPPYMGDRNTSRTQLVCDVTVQRLLESANIRALERIASKIEPCDLEFLPAHWLAGGPPPRWFDAVKFLREHNFDITNRRFTKIYLIAAGYNRAPDLEERYESVRRPDLDKLRYLVNARVPIDIGVRRGIMYSHRVIFDILMCAPNTLGVVIIDEEVAAYGSVRFLAGYQFSAVTKRIISLLAQRELYSIMLPLIAQRVTAGTTVNPDVAATIPTDTPTNAPTDTTNTTVNAFSTAPTHAPLA